MKIEDISHLYEQSAESAALVKVLGDDVGGRVMLEGLLASAAPMLFASVYERLGRTTLFILQDQDEAAYFYNDLAEALDKERVLFFPSGYRRAVKYGQRDSASEILRTETLAALSAGRRPFVVSYPEALSELVVRKQDMTSRIIKLTRGETVDVSELLRRLRSLGFEEADYVYEPGQFALRGSILDVYSFTGELPFRIDFFGNEIDTIRTFEVESQLSADRKESVEIAPELAKADAAKANFLSFLPEGSLVAAKDFAYVRDVIGRTYNEGFSSQALTERLEGATEVEQADITRQMSRESTLSTVSEYDECLQRFRQLTFGAAASRGADDDDKTVKMSFHITPQPLFHKNFDLLRHTMKDYLAQGYRIFILADSLKQQQRLRDIFDETGSDRERTAIDSQRSDIDYEPVLQTLHEGYADNDLRICLFTDHQIFDRYHKYTLRSDAARSGKMALTLKELQEMEVGDYIVHVDFGIGKFGGLVRLPNSNGGYQEAIRIIYQHGDKVDVSIHSLYKVSKYRRSDTGEPPKLSVLGTGAWQRLKERTKKRIKDIARDLIRLYAKRRKEQGFAFSPDNYMQRELEASFLYEDTPDQLKATQEVKADMESARPMDRLVCGDVGFGKTEVAIRAAFKAACDSKQTAVLVPTTVLAFQHYQTFRDRLKGMPVRVDYLSRARSAKQTRQVLDDLAAGRIDIIIGTHKLIGKSVHWHDLGLLVIDEEQKFGVAVKERLRKLKTNVDTLTMSATPIPRTLQFSLMGARDMSIIRTPPPNRYPIHTELATYGHEIIADAINFEMSRGGQVFFVSNRINSLEEIKRLILGYVPDCRVAIGHGQMDPNELEKIIMGFINYDYDVLLSTTIIENGIDIPNANTIIINDAQRFGLADLHQMRGRVGRSNKKAFCYLLAPPKSVLSPDARRRLEALESFSELGSGFNIALQDLDIRGAGNLLGAEQSGFIEDLGYETYQKILSQAVTELKNDEFQDIYKQQMAEGKAVSGDEFVDDCAIESDLEMYFPDTYVPGASERMLLYKELDNISDDDALNAYRQRLQDRFGPLPHEGEELLQVVALRRLGRKLGCEKIILRQGTMTMQLVSNPESAYYKSETFDGLINYMMTHPQMGTFREVRGRRMLRFSNVRTVQEAVNILRDITKQP